MAVVCLLIELFMLFAFMLVADFVLTGAFGVTLMAMCDLVEWYTNKLGRWRRKGGNPRDSSL